jgi:hypothetical protein
MLKGFGAAVCFDVVRKWLLTKNGMYGMILKTTERLIKMKRRMIYIFIPAVILFFVFCAFSISVGDLWWESYEPMPQQNYYHSCGYSDITGVPTVYSLGGHGNYQSIFEFSCETETWSTSSSLLNHAVQWHACAVVKGKIYCIAGCDGSYTAEHYNQEFDPVTGVVTDRAPLLTARYCHTAVTWNDSLIYVIGGQAASYYNSVEVYNPSTDSWAFATSLPTVRSRHVCGLYKNTIVVAGGYSGGGYVSYTYVGTIDTLNPQSISWSIGPSLPPGPSGQPLKEAGTGAVCEDKFFITCFDDYGVPLTMTLYVDFANPSMSWNFAPDKPTYILKRQSGLATYAPTLDNGTFFCAGGSYSYNITEGLCDIKSMFVAEEKRETREWNDVISVPSLTGSSFTISYSLPEHGMVHLLVYDATGREVKTILDAPQDAGTREIQCNMADAPTGIYFLVLNVNGLSFRKKITIIN